MNTVRLILPTMALLLVTSMTSYASSKPTFTKAGHTTDTLKTVKQRLADDTAVLLDVREQDEWKAGHLKDAKLLPLSVVRQGQLTEQQKKLLPKDKPVYCHCRSGGRVLVVSKILRAQGYDIRPLKSGYADLVESGFEPAEK